jgi:hypothetical protein
MEILVLFVCGLICSVAWILNGILRSGPGRDFLEAVRPGAEIAARRLSGSCVPGPLGTRLVRYDQEGVRAELRFRPGDGVRPPSTGVEFPLRSPSPGTLHLCAERFKRALGTIYGDQDLEAGEREFDRRYVIRATPPSLVSSLFHPDRRYPLVAAVAGLEPLGPPELELTRDRLAVRVGALLEDPDRIVDLAKRAARLLELMTEVGAGSDIHWEQAETTDAGLCQVCGAALLERVVHCASCRTPHHEECWRWTGECSTFACRETRYLVDGRAVSPPRKRQTPDEWLEEELERDRREHGRRR